jgi:hypothetical protein
VFCVARANLPAAATWLQADCYKTGSSKHEVALLLYELQALASYMPIPQPHFYLFGCACHGDNEGCAVNDLILAFNLQPYL